MTTKHTVKVPRKLFRRRWLFLLPGTEWVVTAIEQRGKRMTPVYTLTCYGHEIVREEWRVKPLGGQKARAAG